MRAVLLISVLVFSGCCGSHDCRPRPESEAKSDASECATGDCCATPSRADLLQTKSDAPVQVELKTIQFADFMKEVKRNQGRVVAAYQWTSASPASKKNLPTMVELQAKFGKDGLICLTAASDPAKASSETLKQLQETRCSLTNYLQDENDPIDGWASCFGCCGFPSLVIFGRDGKKAASFEVTELPFEAAALEKAIVPLLQAK